MTLSFVAKEHSSISEKIVQMKHAMLKDLLEEITSFLDMSEVAQGILLTHFSQTWFQMQAHILPLARKAWSGMHVLIYTYMHTLERR